MAVQGYFAFPSRLEPLTQHTMAKNVRSVGILALLCAVFVVSTIILVDAQDLSLNGCNPGKGHATIPGSTQVRRLAFACMCSLKVFVSRV